MDEIKLFRSIILEYDNPYIYYHAKRYEILIEFVKKNFSKGKKMLDIGNSSFAEILHTIFNSKVDELGFSADSTKHFGKQFKFDLNDSSNNKLWRKDLGLYDIIIFAEVIEHLYTSPNQVLAFLFSLLKEDGKLILQTPNAVVFHKRIQMLFGKNPYMLISENKFNPGHFREYTTKELTYYANHCGFKVEKIQYANYFDYQYTFAQRGENKVNKLLKLINLMYSILPSTLKPGITLILTKKSVK